MYSCFWRHNLHVHISFVPRTVPFDFSENSLKDLLATLRLRKIVDAAADGMAWTSKRLEIRFHDRLKLIKIGQLVELMKVCSRRQILLRGIGSPRYLNWQNALEISKAMGEDVTTLKHSRDIWGTPHLMSIYESECKLRAFAEKTHKRITTRIRRHSTTQRSMNEGNEFKKEIVVVDDPDPQKVKKAWISFHRYDEPLQIAEDWIDKNVTGTLGRNKEIIAAQIASQIIPMNPITQDSSIEEERQFVSHKLRVMFRLQQHNIAKREFEQQVQSKLIHNAFGHVDDKEKYTIKWSQLLDEMRKEGLIAPSDSRTKNLPKPMRQEPAEPRDDGAGRLTMISLSGSPAGLSVPSRIWDSFAEYPLTERDLFEILAYLSDCGGEIEYEDTSKSSKLIKGNIHQNISIYQQCIGLGFDLNAVDVSTGETLLFSLIRKYDVDSLRQLLFETAKQQQPVLDILNHKGRSPLFYALRGYLETGKKDLYLLLLQAGADPNFSCIKTAKVIISPLFWLLSDFSVFCAFESAEILYVQAKPHSYQLGRFQAQR